MTTAEMYKGKIWKSNICEMYGSQIFVKCSVRGSSIYEKIGKLMHNICDERFLNVTVCFGFSPPKAPKRTKNNNYGIILE